MFKARACSGARRVGCTIVRYSRLSTGDTAKSYCLVGIVLLENKLNARGFIGCMMTPTTEDRRFVRC
jgi:hypothetical protein